MEIVYLCPKIAKRMGKKTVSVVMCTYNGEQYLREQLDSILTQSYPPYEIIIQDDCSTDGTIDILHEYAKSFPQVKVFLNKHNLGFNNNFKSAVMRATGDYVAISDQDDIWFPEKLQKQVETIADHDICFSVHLRGSSQDNSVVVRPNYSFEGMLFTGFAGHTMLLRTSFAQKDESWIEGIVYDWSLGVNAHLGRGIVRVEEPLNWHRSHQKSAIRQLRHRLFPSENPHPTWQPYFYGISNYRKLQASILWERFYGYLYQHTDNEHFALQHTMCRLMLSKRAIDLWRLCRLCMKHRQTVYPDSAKTKGLVGRIRSFCYPLIFAYQNQDFNS